MKKSEEEEKNSLLFYLCLSSEREREEFLKPRLPFLLKMLPADNEESEFPPSQAAQSVESKNPVPSLRLGKYDFFQLFQFRDVTNDDVALLYPLLRKAPAPVLLCDKLSDNGKTLCDKLSVNYLDGALLYRAFKDGECIPSDYPIKTTTPLKRKRRNICFSKSNSRRFFGCGVLLLVSSVFVPYPIYYLIFGGLLLALSVFVRIFGYR